MQKARPVSLHKSGYPRNRPGLLIHKFAKIIAVADVYSALIADRPYRKAQSPYQAMRTLVEMGGAKKLDRDIIRAFLKFVCLFPVGSWVKLNNGEKAKIISSNAGDYTKPVVRVIFDAESKKTNRVVDLLKDNDVGIVDGLNWDDKDLTADMAGF